MREIKFRAWVRFESGNYGMLEHENLLEWSLAELLDDEGTDSLMQFTGLLDKNGKEIYEGDVICCTLGKHFMGMQPFRRWLVCEWAEGAFYWKRIRFEGEGEDENSGGKWTIHNFCNFCPVVGNIYENPNLLQ